MTFITVGDLDICHERMGAGPPLLLISGTGGDLRNAPLAANPLVAHFDVIAYDQRGLGRTSKPAGPYSMADYADDAAALLAALGVGRAHVVGISFGGMVAQHLAVRHPDVVDRLVLMCTSPGGDHPSADLLALSEMDPEARAAAYLPLLDTRAVPGQPLPDDLARVLRVLDGRRQATEPDELRGARLQLEARAGHDVVEALAGVGARTLVMGGRTDGIAPLSNLEAIVDRIPDATLAMHDGGHLFMLQDPTAWPAAIEFLAS